jgi:hypothetical protein
MAEPTPYAELPDAEIILSPEAMEALRLLRMCSGPVRSDGEIISHALTMLRTLEEWVASGADIYAKPPRNVMAVKINKRKGEDDG